MSAIIPPKTPQQLKAATIEQTAYQAYEQMLQTWSRNVAALWDDPRPDLVLEALGAKGVGIFQASSLTAAYLESIRPGCTAPALAKVRPFTIHTDGTVTIDP